MKKTLLLFLTCYSFVTQSQELGRYEFTGTGACPNQNPSVTSQPSNGQFSDFGSNTVECVVSNNVFNTDNWTLEATVDLTKYLEFTLTANNGYLINIDSLNFSSRISSNTANWHLRSNIDNFSSDLHTMLSTNILDTISLPILNHSNLSSVTFRFYVTDVTDNLRAWRIDDVILFGQLFVNAASLEQKNAAIFSLFPNPTEGDLTFESKKPGKIEFYDLMGKKITEIEHNGDKLTINTENFSNGSYFVVYNTDESSHTIKWQKL